MGELGLTGYLMPVKNTICQRQKLKRKTDFFDVEIIRPRTITDENGLITTDYDRLRPITTN